VYLWCNNNSVHVQVDLTEYDFVVGLNNENGNHWTLVVSNCTYNFHCVIRLSGIMLYVVCLGSMGNANTGISESLVNLLWDMAQ